MKGALDVGGPELLQQLSLVIGIDERTLKAASRDDRVLDDIMNEGSEAALDFKNIVAAFKGLVDQLEKLDERVIELMICPGNYEKRWNELVLMHLQRMSASYLAEDAEAKCDLLRQDTTEKEGTEEEGERKGADWLFPEVRQVFEMYPVQAGEPVQGQVQQLPGMPGVQECLSPRRTAKDAASSC